MDKFDNNSLTGFKSIPFNKPSTSTLVNKIEPAPFSSKILAYSNAD